MENVTPLQPDSEKLRIITQRQYGNDFEEKGGTVIKHGFTKRCRSLMIESKTKTLVFAFILRIKI